MTFNVNSYQNKYDEKFYFVCFFADWENSFYLLFSDVHFTNIVSNDPRAEIKMEKL